MPRKPGKVPSYCLHKASGQAVVRIDGTDHYLGPYGSLESHEAYERAIAESRIRRSQSSVLSDVGRGLTINSLILAYLKFAASYYVKGGKPTKELVEMKHALRPLRKLLGRSLVPSFGPLALKAIRQHMIDANLSRGVINHRINRIRRVFKWGVSEQLVPPAVFQALRTVDGLRYGRSEARAAPPVKPVSQAWVDQVVSHLSPPVAAMVRLQQLTAMRPGEVVLMRACDIDTTGDVWLYRPHDHKNRWRDAERIIPLGPNAQAIVSSFLKLNRGVNKLKR